MRVTTTTILLLATTLLAGALPVMSEASNPTGHTGHVEAKAVPAPQPAGMNRLQGLMHKGLGRAKQYQDQIEKNREEREKAAKGGEGKKGELKVRDPEAEE